MDEQDKARMGLGSRISRWENNFSVRHPVIYPIVTEFIAELMIALVLALFAFHMLPPDLNFAVSQKSTESSILSIVNEGFLFGSGQYLIESGTPLANEPVILAGRKYVDEVERVSDKSFSVQVSGIPYKKEVKAEFGSGTITVIEE